MIYGSPFRDQTRRICLRHTAVFQKAVNNNVTAPDYFICNFLNLLYNKDNFIFFDQLPALSSGSLSQDGALPAKRESGENPEQSCCCIRAVLSHIHCRKL